MEEARQSDKIADDRDENNGNQCVHLLDANVYLFPADIHLLRPMANEFVGYFKFFNYAIKNVDISGRVNMVHLKCDYEIYQIGNKDSEITAVKWKPFPEKIQSFNNAKKAFKECPILSSLLPADLNPPFSLGDIVRIQGELKWHRSETQVRIVTWRLINEQLLNYTNREAFRMKALVYKKPKDTFNIKPRREQFTSNELMNILAEKYKGALLPNCEEIIHFLHSNYHNKGEHDMSCLRQNVMECFDGLVLEGFLVQHSSSLLRYRFMDRDLQLYKDVKNMISSYSEPHEGISGLDLFRGITGKSLTRYSCLEMKPFIKYVKRKIEDQDFFEPSPGYFCSLQAL